MSAWKTPLLIGALVAGLYVFGYAGRTVEAQVIAYPAYCYVPPVYYTVPVYYYAAPVYYAPPVYYSYPVYYCAYPRYYYAYAPRSWGFSFGFHYRH